MIRIIHSTKLFVSVVNFSIKLFVRVAGIAGAGGICCLSVAGISSRNQDLADVRTPPVVRSEETLNHTIPHKN